MIEKTSILFRREVIKDREVSAVHFSLIHFVSPFICFVLLGLSSLGSFLEI